MDEKRSGGEGHRRPTEEELCRMVPIDLATLEAVLFRHALLEEEDDDSSKREEQKDQRGED